jgi:hypothetical protein
MVVTLTITTPALHVLVQVRTTNVRQTRTNTMGGNLRYMNKTVFPSAVGRRPAPTHTSPLSLHYTLTFNFPMGTNRPQFPTAPGSWVFRPHAGAYQ